MKKKIALLSTILLLLSTKADKLSAQYLTTLGTDFWVSNLTFRGHNCEALAGSFAGNSVSTLHLTISAPRTTTVTIQRPNTDYDSTITIEAMSTVGIQLGYNRRSSESGAIHDYGFHITSTDSIAVLAMSGNGGSTDYTCLLPTSALSSRYIRGVL